MTVKTADKLSWRQMLDEVGIQPRLFDQWNLYAEPSSGLERGNWSPPLPPEKTPGSSKIVERWGYHQVMRALLREMPGARCINRGEAVVMTDEPWTDGQFQIQGDLDLSWEGRSPIVEVKAYLPYTDLRYRTGPHKGSYVGKLSAGLDQHVYDGYLLEARRCGRPFYVVWVYSNVPGEVVMRGGRIDLLDDSPNKFPWSKPDRRKGHSGSILQWYWILDDLWTIPELVADIAAWDGSPFQLELAGI